MANPLGGDPGHLGIRDDVALHIILHAIGENHSGKLDSGDWLPDLLLYEPSWFCLRLALPDQVTIRHSPRRVVRCMAMPIGGIYGVYCPLQYPNV